MRREIDIFAVAVVIGVGLSLWALWNFICVTCCFVRDWFQDYMHREV